MAGINRLTGVALLTTGEGDRVAFTYSTLDADGNLVSGNNKGSFVVLDEELRRHMEAIRNYVTENKLSKIG